MLSRRARAASLYGDRPCSGHAAITSCLVRGAIIGPLYWFPNHLVGARNTGWPQIGHSPLGLPLHDPFAGLQSHDQARRSRLWPTSEP